MTAFEICLHDTCIIVLCLLPNHGISFIVVLWDTKLFQIQVREYLRDFTIIIPYCLDIEIVHSYLGKNRKI